MPDFSQRSNEIEIMDDLLCRGEVVHQTLRELDFINKWLGGNQITINGVQHLLKNIESRTFTIADLGCGSGDILKQLAQWGRRNNLSLNLIGYDANPSIIEFARIHCKEFDEITFQSQNIFDETFRKQKFDIVTGTLFYHHFKNEELIPFLSNLKSQVSVGFIINDLHRHPLAYYSIKFLTRIFSRSAMVRFDAPLSVMRAFNRSELHDVLHKAGIENVQIRWKWAFRWQVWHSF